ncbi:TolC family protein [Flavobacterium sp. W20_MBD1_R3]|uniref:TolC family protein n=1 Tax=Flavobacterium sp. W20_MBD1_R3 TaxID=3240278 RepID=UPI003F8F9B61
MKTKLILILLFYSNSFIGQDLLSFNACMNLALENNLALKNAYLSREIQYNYYRSSFGKLLPSINGTVENKNSWGREIDPDTNLFVNKKIQNYSGDVEAEYNLFSGFSTINKIKSSKQDVISSDANIQKIKNEITIDLAQKFITILYLQEIILSNEEQIKSSEKQLELAVLKFNSGVIAESEVFKIKSQKAIEELNLLTNKNYLTDNLISIKQLINISLERTITLLQPDLVLHDKLDLDKNQYFLTRKAVEIHPSYVMRISNEQKMKTEVSIAKASLYPSLSLRLIVGSNYIIKDPFVSFEKQFNTNFSKGLRFNLTIPIFNQFDNFSKIKNSKLQYNQSKIETLLEENRLSKEILKAITDTKTSFKKNESAAIAFEFSKKSYEADVLKFELGKININELNNTKMNFSTSQAELIQSKYELLYNNALIRFYLGEKFVL